MREVKLGNEVLNIDISDDLGIKIMVLAAKYANVSSIKDETRKAEELQEIIANAIELIFDEESAGKLNNFLIDFVKNVSEIITEKIDSLD